MSTQTKQMLLEDDDMESKDTILREVIQKVDSLEDFLQDILPSVDRIHKEEILDICLLLKQRVTTYVNEYGIVSGDENF